MSASELLSAEAQFKIAENRGRVEPLRYSNNTFLATYLVLCMYVQTEYYVVT